jgi:hypothetical protein
MPALLTDRDRQIYRLQQQIHQQEIWLDVDAADKRAVAWHKSLLLLLRDELNKLSEGD